MPECPDCNCNETVQISSEQFACLKCGEVFVVPAKALATLGDLEAVA